MISNEIVEGIKSRKDFKIFIETLIKDFKENKKSWENQNLEDFLDALGRYSEDIDGYYKNAKINIDPDKVNWRVFADCLCGAAVYE